jgi:hypothetical protein
MGGKARVGLSQGITRTLDELAPVLDRHKGGILVRRHVRELGEAMEQDRLHDLEAVIRRVLVG